jgi:hypothetical protein
MAANGIQKSTKIPGERIMNPLDLIPASFFIMMFIFIAVIWIAVYSGNKNEK